MDFKETESQFAILAESLPQLLWATSSDGCHDYFNRRWYDFTGLSHEQSVGEGWVAALHPNDVPAARTRWAHALNTGMSYEGEHRIRSVKGEYLWFLVRALPIRDASGKIMRWFGTCTEIHAQKMAEDALRRLDEQHRIALEAAGLGTWDYDVGTGIVSWDERACALFGIFRDDFHSIPFKDAFKRVHPDDIDPLKAYIATALTSLSDGRYNAEYRIIMRDGGIRWIRATGQVFFVKDGDERRAVRVSGVCSDITERRAIKEAHQLLTSELNHRVKNLFAIASGLVSMTARTARDPKEMATALRGRLSALSKAHELVRPAPGQGTGLATNLGELVDAIITPYKQDGRRIGMEGPPVRIGTNAMTSLALVLHELTTNAAKYGCLSSPVGELTIQWTLEGEAVDLVWTEAGGPPITETPTFRGFGTILSQRTVTGQLGGALDQDWRKEGLIVSMVIPVERLST